MIVAAHAQRTVLLPGVHHDHDRRQSAIHRQAHTTGGRNGASRSSDGRLDIKLLSLGAPGNGTNPEQMFAAGWSACFMGAMGVAAAKMKTRLPADAAIDAEVDLCDAGGLEIAGEVVALAHTLAAVEENHVGVPCRERLHICRRSLPLCTRESALDGRQIVEVERRDQMKVGRAPRGCNRTLADLVLSETGDFLRDRNVGLEVVFVTTSFGALYITTSRAIMLLRRLIS